MDVRSERTYESVEQAESSAKKQDTASPDRVGKFSEDDATEAGSYEEDTGGEFQQPYVTAVDVKLCHYGIVVWLDVLPVPTWNGTSELVVRMKGGVGGAYGAVYCTPVSGL